MKGKRGPVEAKKPTGDTAAESKPPPKKPGQPILPNVAPAIFEEIEKELRLGKEHEAKRMEHGTLEQKHKKNAAAMLEQYELETFNNEEPGAGHVEAYWEIKKKLKIRVGDAVNKAGQEDDELDDED